METLQFKFTAEDMAHLRQLCANDSVAFNSLATCCADGVSLTRNEAEHLRSHLTTMLAMIGFDDDYGLTDEGEYIERLIDTLNIQ